MSFTAGALLPGGTTSTTGGTSTGLISKGNTLNEHNLVLDDSSEFINQTNFQVTVKEPKVSASAPNGYTQQRSKILVKVPLGLDNGSRTVNTISVELACDIETTDAERLVLLEHAAQLLTKSDFGDFWNKQSLE